MADSAYVKSSCQGSAGGGAVKRRRKERVNGETKGNSEGADRSNEFTCKGKREEVSQKQPHPPKERKNGPPRFLLTR
jgi:hypothetical protein